MAKTAAQRRAARKRKQQQRHRSQAGGHQQTASWPPRNVLLDELIHTGAWHADGAERERIVTMLAELDPDLDSGDSLTAQLVEQVRELWERGWQPADVAHVVRRQASQRVTRLAVAAIAVEARAAGAESRAPDEWQAQLSAIGALSSDAAAADDDADADADAADDDDDAVTGWRRAERLEPADAWRDVLWLIGELGSLGQLQQLSPPPSRWQQGARPRRTASAVHGADPRMLGRIRALLAKAESTDFPEEAEALSAKAQDLMARYAIDAAVLDAEHGASLADEVVARRVHIDNPYSEAKVQLLTAVGTVNGVRVIWLEAMGIATVVGLPVDLDLVDLLFTSLLVQATRAMSDTGRAGGRHTRSPSFRRSFLLSYAIRIGERLREVHDSATEEATRSHGAALVPVLRERGQAVDDVFDRLFPQTTVVESRAMNAHGWHAGRLAAETADLGSGREQVRG